VGEKNEAVLGFSCYKASRMLNGYNRFGEFLRVIQHGKSPLLEPSKGSRRREIELTCGT
jgi:hypothetical protein